MILNNLFGYQLKIFEDETIFGNQKCHDQKYPKFILFYIQLLHNNNINLINSNHSILNIKCKPQNSMKSALNGNKSFNIYMSQIRSKHTKFKKTKKNCSKKGVKKSDESVCKCLHVWLIVENIGWLWLRLPKKCS